jgi:hypothetical protein
VGALATRLLERSAPSRVELAGFAALLVAVTAALLGSHVVNGGFVSDDWTLREIYIGAGESNLFDGIAAFYQEPAIESRPLNAVYQSFLQTAFGDNMDLALAWTVLLTALVAWSLYLLLRTLKIEPLHAGLISLLVLLFPASSAPKLWLAASGYQLAIVFWLLGVTVVLRAFDSRGNRATVLHGVSLALFLASVALYEVALVAILASVLLYLARAPRRDALRRWAVDAAVLGLWALLITSDSTFEAQSGSGYFDHAAAIAGDAAALFGETVIPLGAPKGVLFILALALLGAADFAIRRLREGDPRRAELRRWLVIAGAGLLVIGAGYVMYAPTDDIYAPLTEGLWNRMNAVAAIGWAGLTYSLLMLLGLLLLSARPNWRRAATGLAVVGALAIGISYAVNLRDDADAYNRGFTEGQQVVETISANVAPLEKGEALYSFGPSLQAKENIPVFDVAWDLDGALAYEWGYRDRLGREAFPVHPDTEFECEPKGVKASGDPLYVYPGATHVTPYGKTTFVNGLTGDSQVVRNRKACRSAVRDEGRFPRGDFFL